MKKIVRLTESDLARIVKRVIKENSLLTEGVPLTTMSAPNPSVAVDGRSVCGTIDYIRASVKLKAGPEADVYITPEQYPLITGLPQGLGNLIRTTYEFNIIDPATKKPMWSNPENQKQMRIPKGKEGIFNFVIMTDLRPLNNDFNTEMQMAMELKGSKKVAAENAAREKRTNRRNAFQAIKSATLQVRYNGQPLNIPMTFGGFQIDGNRACDAVIQLPKGF